MIQKLDLTAPIRIQLRHNGQHEVDPDWWRAGDDSETEKARRRESWSDYMENENGKIVHSVALNDTVRIYENNTIAEFYVRSIEEHGDDYVVTYGRLNLLGGDSRLYIPLDQNWVK